MTKFEQWFSEQDFYTNMRFIHGDALFCKDGDVYRVLPVQMTWVAWSKKPELGKPFDFDLLDHHKSQVNHLTEMNKRYLGKMCEHHGRIAAAKAIIKRHERYIPQSTIEALEKALRGDK